MKEIQKDPREPIELNPREWRSDRPKHREPILGAGAGAMVGELAVMAIGLVLLIVVVLAGIYLKSAVHDLLFGKPDVRIEAQPTRAEIEAEMKRRGLLP